MVWNSIHSMIYDNNNIISSIKFSLLRDREVLYVSKTRQEKFAQKQVSSFINIGGLTIGMTVAMLIGLWVYDELSFNKYHRNYDRIAQIMVRGNDPKEGPFINNSVQYPLATELQTNYKNHFKHIVRGSWVRNIFFQPAKKNFPQRTIYG